MKIQIKYKNLFLNLELPLSDITNATFTEWGIIFHIGVAPRRIDIITHIDGVNFKNAFKNKNIVNAENLNIPFLSKEDLIIHKQSTKREKDKLDLKYLKNTNIQQGTPTDQKAAFIRTNNEKYR